MHNKHKIFAFVGPSGCGKSTLILELTKLFPHLSIVKTTTTRLKRDETDLLFCNFLTLPQFHRKIANKDFINFQEYAGNWYGTDAKETKKLLKDHCGLMAMVENSIPIARAAGIEIVPIRITPEIDFEHERALQRKADDLARARTPLDFTLKITNSFKPGGLEKSIQQLSEFFKNTL